MLYEYCIADDWLKHFRIGVSRSITAEGRPTNIDVCADSRDEHRGELKASEHRGFKCARTRRYVVVTLTIYGVLTLCEVEIYGNRNGLKDVAGM